MAPVSKSNEGAKIKQLVPRARELLEWRGAAGLWRQHCSALQGRRRLPCQKCTGCRHTEHQFVRIGIAINLAVRDLMLASATSEEDVRDRRLLAALWQATLAAGIAERLVVDGTWLPFYDFAGRIAAIASPHHA